MKATPAILQTLEDYKRSMVFQIPGLLGSPSRSQIDNPWLATRKKWANKSAVAYMKFVLVHGTAF